jgi:hypothetical protein
MSIHRGDLNGPILIADPNKAKQDGTSRPFRRH